MDEIIKSFMLVITSVIIAIIIVEIIKQDRL